MRFDKSGLVYHTKLIHVTQVKGRQDTRTVRLYRKAIPLLDELHSGLSARYMETFKRHNFSGDPFHIWRNHRVAEALAACMAAGVEVRPYVLPPLQKTLINHIVPEVPSFYIARDFKKADADHPNKTMYTRIVGALFCPGDCYAVYNTRGAVMKWSGRGELKSMRNLLELARMNAGLDEISAALLFGASYDVAVKTVLESDRSARQDMRFDRIYTRVHFIPLDPNGIRLLKMLILPDWNERLLSVLFAPEERSYNLGSMEYDAIVNGKKILSHLDGDIARLIRFREALRVYAESAEVLCFPWQTGFLQAYLGDAAGIRELEMRVVETALGL
ncbi:MAG: hypothetical protein LBL26_02535 [Peptococcaceae bacterium]|nr:hypothetical protein [Peptococcaceae bacterium]